MSVQYNKRLWNNVNYLYEMFRYFLEVMNYINIIHMKLLYQMFYQRYRKEIKSFL